MHRLAFVFSSDTASISTMALVNMDINTLLTLSLFQCRKSNSKSLPRKVELIEEVDMTTGAEKGTTALDSPA